MPETADAIHFHASTLGSLGVEMEWITVDTATGMQTPAAPILLQRISETPRIKAELFTSTIEINTDIHHNTAACVQQLADLYAHVSTKLVSQHASLLSSGTHPLSGWQDQVISDDPRYHRLVERLQWVVRRFNIFGIHAHIGMPDGDTCISTMNRLLPIMPVFLAISANSPFWVGHDTGMASTRIKIFEGLSQGGMPFYFEDWRDFEHCATRLMETKSIDSVRDIWWEMRPHPDFGTLEIRIGDMPRSRKDTEAYIAYARAETMAAATPHVGNRSRVHPSLIRENRWRACRHGMQATIISPQDEKLVPLLEWLEARLDTLAGQNADEADLQCVARRIEAWRHSGGGAEHQRRLRTQFPDWPDMIHAMRLDDGWNDA